MGETHGRDKGSYERSEGDDRGVVRGVAMAVMGSGLLLDMDFKMELNE